MYFQVRELNSGTQGIHFFRPIDEDKGRSIGEERASRGIDAESIRIQATSEHPEGCAVKDIDALIAGRLGLKNPDTKTVRTIRDRLLRDWSAHGSATTLKEGRSRVVVWQLHERPSLVSSSAATPGTFAEQDPSV